MDHTVTYAAPVGSSASAFHDSFMPYRPAQASTQDHSTTSYDSSSVAQHDTMMNGGIHGYATVTDYQTWDQTRQGSNNFHQYAIAAPETEPIPQTGRVIHEVDLGQENARLQSEVERLQHDSIAGQRALDDMMTNLIDVQTELETTRDHLARKEADYAALYSRLGSPAHGSLHNGAQQVTQHVITPDPHQQQRIDELTAELRVKDEFLKARDAEIVSLETRWQTRLDQREEHFDQRRSQLESALTTERAATSEVQQRLDTQAAAHIAERQQLAAKLADAQTASQAAAANETQAEKVVELQRLVQFFKNNSERTAEQAKQLREKNLRAAEDLRAMERELQDLKALNATLGRLNS